ncbi:DUF3618 domain-containing protein [Ovoidimarina sediminis]|uniref:DUF3618 domain-containing protein n=1 Tax=Ovoidimarina sediminis TaxID=3079856 RepID=UPI00290951A1|nr:DUF3618 domain-containing protein [Rhodophyticola sp. MJ-SS7]MDU8944626.1 DUF3618 domain-containing protein [Rhodophyticola sp. MJ-SS7]
MTDQSPQEIEREIAAERSALETSIEALQAQFSTEALVEQASGMIKTHGSEIAQSVARTARENPAALALTGIGLVWLLAGKSEDKPERNGSVAAYDTRSRPTATGFRAEPIPPSEFEERIVAAEATMKSDARPDPAIAGGTAHHLKETQSMTDTYYGSRASVETGDQDFRTRAYAKAADLRRRIDEGTTDMTDAARERVRQAREAAITAQEAVERHARGAARTVRRSSQDNPLLFGALTFAAGALLAASLPRTSTEDRALGTHRDRLFDEADRVFREEADRMKAAAKTAIDEGKTAAKEAYRG